MSLPSQCRMPRPVYTPRNSRNLPAIVLLFLSSLPLSVTALAEDRSPQKVYQAVCARCHEEGIALSIRGFPAAVVQWKVRNSVGAMPRFPATDIDDQSLSELGAYIQQLKPIAANQGERQ
ncbi:cytochrome c [Pseudomonas brenneri]|jgi:cytochrome c553|uniref:c-type cytochrome n=1 Tax=Pseudomonas TaxID=286 RepID=UPI0010296FFB|nr:cytochrome c [Pseudomonas mohnii]MBH8609875.1 cytochrome c [Pseudomonas mohnii]MBM6443868.1 cytochrome c [Pseudomonas sp. MIL9]RZO06865.1 cytochrome c [Pseudomonas moorei]